MNSRSKFQAAVYALLAKSRRPSKQEDKIIHSKQGEKVNKARIVINVSGQRYETFEHTLNRFPDTLLGNTLTREKYFNINLQEFFFNRSHMLFENILFFYQSNGTLRCPLNVSFVLFESECRYFQIPDKYILSMKEKEGFIALPKLYNLTPKNIYDKIRHIINYPRSSKLARFYSIISAFMTIGSILLMCAQSFPEFHYHEITPTNSIFIFDIIFTLWFILDTTLRIAVSSSMISVIKNPVIWLDFLGSYPYILMVITQKSDINWISFFRIFRTFKILRLLRMFITPRQEELLLNIFHSGIGELVLLLLCVFIVVIFGASLIYVIESPQKETAFTSIPECSWWSLQTVIMIGYGDIIPQTILGKCCATVVMVLGATTIALPVLAVASTFVDKYKRNSEDSVNEIIEFS